MGRKVRTYSRVTEAGLLIKKLHEKHPDAFWCVRPELIAVMGIDNVERSEKAVEKQPIWSKMSAVKGVEGAIFQENKILERYIIEVFWSDWHTWTEEVKLAVLAQHLFEVTPELEAKNSTDCVGFKILFDVMGVNWEREDWQSLPNLLSESVQFNLKLRPGLSELESLEEDGGPEDPGGPDL